MKNIITIVIIIAFLAIGGFFIFRPSGSSPTLQNEAKVTDTTPATVSGSFKRGEVAPDVSFSDFEGNSYNLSDFKGKAVVLDFWAGWCPFCVAEMPELQKAQESYPEDLVMIGVHRTDTEALSTGLKFASDLDITYLLVSDKSGALYRAAGGFGMPVAVFIDKQGAVREVKSGPKTTEEIREKVGDLVE